MSDIKNDLNFKSSSDDITKSKSKKLTFISFNDLEPCEHNKKIYQVHPIYVEQLRTTGLETPFKVLKNNNGKYTILSGNQRYESFKVLLDKDTSFKFTFNQVDDLSPIEDGIPCIVVQNEMSDSEFRLSILDNNKSRDLDKLELYHTAMEAKQLYDDLKIEGLRVNEFASLHVNASPRTLADIYENKWLINEENLAFVEDAGSYEKWKEENNDKSSSKSSNNSAKSKVDPFNKEFDYLDKVETHHNKLNLELFDEQQTNDLRTNAISAIKAIMDIYTISAKEITR